MFKRRKSSGKEWCSMLDLFVKLHKELPKVVIGKQIDSDVETFFLVEKLAVLKFAKIHILEPKDWDKYITEKGDDFVQRFKQYVGKDYLIPLSNKLLVTPVHKSYDRQTFSSIREVICNPPRYLRVENDATLTNANNTINRHVAAQTRLEINDVKMGEKCYIDCTDSTNFKYRIYEQTNVILSGFPPAKEVTLETFVKMHTLPKIVSCRPIFENDICAIDNDTIMLFLTAFTDRIKIVEVETERLWIVWMKDDDRCDKCFRILMVPEHCEMQIVAKLCKFKNAEAENVFIEANFPNCRLSSFVGDHLYNKCCDVNKLTSILIHNDVSDKQTKCTNCYQKTLSLNNIKKKDTSGDIALQHDIMEGISEKPKVQLSNFTHTPPSNVNRLKDIHQEMQSTCIQDATIIEPYSPQNNSINNISKPQLSEDKSSVNIQETEFKTKIVPLIKNNNDSSLHKANEHIKSLEHNLLDPSTYINVTSDVGSYINQQCVNNNTELFKETERKTLEGNSNKQKLVECRGLDEMNNDYILMNPMERLRITNSESTDTCNENRELIEQHPLHLNEETNNAENQTTEDLYKNFPGKPISTDFNYVPHDPEKKIDKVVTFDRNDSKIDFAEVFYRYSVNDVAACFTICGMKSMANICKENHLDGEFFRNIDLTEILTNDPFSLNRFENDKVKRIIQTGWRPVF